MADINMQGWMQRAQQQINEFHARLDAVLVRDQQQVQAAEWRLEGTNPSDDDRLGTFYGALDDMREDRAEYQEAQTLALLRERLETLEQERTSARNHEHGMEY
jgi:hypothetical protein